MFDSEDILSMTPPAADARLHYGGEPQQFADLRVPKPGGFWHKFAAGSRGQRHPVVMNIHGGFWRNQYDLLHAGHLCAALTAAGFATWNIEYRRVGDAGGGYPGSLNDVRAAFAMLPHIADQYHFDMERVVVMGHSAGGHLALCLAGHEPAVKRVVSLAGVTDLLRCHELGLSHDAAGDFARGGAQAGSAVEAEAYREADPMRLKIPQAQQVLIHGVNDDVVPLDFARRYAEAKLKQGEQVRLIEVPSAGHFELIDPRSAAWAVVVGTVRNATTL